MRSVAKFFVIAPVERQGLDGDGPSSSVQPSAAAVVNVLKQVQFGPQSPKNLADTLELPECTIYAALAELLAREWVDIVPPFGLSAQKTEPEILVDLQKVVDEHRRIGADQEMDESKRELVRKTLWNRFFDSLAERPAHFSVATTQSGLDALQDVDLLQHS